jgi:hypothetical protein
MLIPAIEIREGDEIVTPKHQNGRVVEAVFVNEEDSLKVTYVTQETEWFSKRSIVLRKNKR